MIPLKDENSTLSTPILSYTIIGICVVVFLIQISSPGFNNGSLFYSYGVIPASLLGTETLPNDLNKIDPYLTLITSMFMHGGFMHLIGNMLYMWIFADNIEDDLGKVKFVLFYLASGIAAAMTQVYLNHLVKIQCQEVKLELLHKSKIDFHFQNQENLFVLKKPKYKCL